MDKQVVITNDVTVRFAGDSGDGMQMTGTLFSKNSGSIGTDVNTFPDYPSEIRPPADTLYGVSAYQVHFGSKKMNTMGDKIDVLFAMNAASVKVNIPNLNKGAIIICNEAGFGPKNLKLAQYENNPLLNGEYSDYTVHAINIPEIMKEELKDLSLPLNQIERTKNFFALGIAYWLFNQPLESTIDWLKNKFGKKIEIFESNTRALKAGYEFAKNDESFPFYYNVPKIKQKPGIYRNITGNEAAALGLVAAAKKADLSLYLGSYPITPATEILHHLSGYKQYGVKILQAEDEIAGIASAIGASFAGNLAVTTTSGPGLSLKVESMGLAVIMELPLVIVDVQRAGPSTGMPTKPEQSDLLMSMWGRHGEAPMPIIAAKSANDCFYASYEAAKIALKYMTPVMVLSDGYLAQGTEPWLVPTLDSLPEFELNIAKNPDEYKPYKRDPETLSREWAHPGTPGFEHQIGGLEKENITGIVTQDPKNHQLMTELRAQKIDGIVRDVPNAVIEGEESGDLLILGWGSSYGAIKNTFDKLVEQGHKLSFVHLRWLNPFPANLGEILSKFKRIFIPEMNMGQLSTLIKTKYLRDVLGYHKMHGKPFTALEIEIELMKLLNGGN
ncbi:MAG: 2-oxoglutarate ferredoxin oxidoreductase subunit alpha [Ignavibacteria bacterium GWF2_33_9]|nr:MAG: 2-oxoglutarate ferredoxin oxidoreductase subunit alpha [Ignavibacteria bacterium GWF2_33_9]